MSSSEQLFLAMLRSQHIREHLLPHLSVEDKCALRRASSACCNLLTKPIFTRITVTFTSSTFTRASRVEALGRVGQHVEHLTFHFAHSDATFLPPLVHPSTGEEVCFLYTPHTSIDSALTRPKYANSQLGDILTQQYPPLFHAATNVPSFIMAMRHLPNLRHLTVRCPGQNPAERYRRDIVDYALISLRIAVERAAVTKLHKLSLSLHPSALNYLRHVAGFGSVPSAGRRWKQITKLHLAIESWDFYGASPGLDHLKIIDDYVRTLAPTLEKLSYTWLGRRGPCPVSLSSDLLFAPPRSSKKLFHEVTSPMSPLPCRPFRGPIHMPRLKHLQIRNAAMNAPQLKQLIASHKDTVREFDFDNVALTDSNTNSDWHDALASAGNERAWSRSSRCSVESGPVSSDDELPSPSAAVDEVGRDLLENDLGGGFPFEAEEIRAAEPNFMDGLESDVAEARKSSFSFTTKLKKKGKRRRRKAVKEEEASEAKTPELPVTPKSSRPTTPERPVTPPKTAWPSPQTTPTRPRRSFRSEQEEPRLMSPIRFSKYRKPSVSTIPEVVPDWCPPEPALDDEEEEFELLKPTVYDPKKPFSGDSGISGVQRDLKREKSQKLMAEDAEIRAKALKQAKEAVIRRLNSQKSKKPPGTVAIAACRNIANRDFVSGRCTDEVLEDTVGMMGRQSMMVPIMLAQ